MKILKKLARIVYSKSDNKMGNKTDEVIEDLFYSFLQRYQKKLEESMRGSEFVFDSVDSFYHKLYEISLN